MISIVSSNNISSTILREGHSAGVLTNTVLVRQASGIVITPEFSYQDTGRTLVYNAKYAQDGIDQGITTGIMRHGDIISIESVNDMSNPTFPGFSLPDHAPINTVITFIDNGSSTIGPGSIVGGGYAGHSNGMSFDSSLPFYDPYGLQKNGIWFLGGEPTNASRAISFKKVLRPTPSGGQPHWFPSIEEFLPRDSNIYDGHESFAYLRSHGTDPRDEANFWVEINAAQGPKPAIGQIKAPFLTAQDAYDNNALYYDVRDDLLGTLYVKGTGETLFFRSNGSRIVNICPIVAQGGMSRQVNNTLDDNLFWTTAPNPNLTIVAMDSNIRFKSITLIGADGEAGADGVDASNEWNNNATSGGDGSGGESVSLRLINCIGLDSTVSLIGGNGGNGGLGGDGDVIDSGPASGGNGGNGGDCSLIVERCDKFNYSLNPGQGGQGGQGGLDYEQIGYAPSGVAGNIGNWTTSGVNLDSSPTPLFYSFLYS